MTGANEDLELVVREKVEPMIEDAMQRFLGVTIRELEADITKKLEQNLLMGLPIRTDLPFKEAKKGFKKEFLKRAIQTNYGNISEAADAVGLDRRSIHRDVRNLGVDVQKLREKLYKQGFFEKEAVDSVIREALEQYKLILHPEKLEKMYGHVNELSGQIVAVLPLQNMKWKDAEREFEKAYLGKLLDENGWNLGKAANAIGLRYETLLRKVNKLGMRM